MKMKKYSASTMPEAMKQIRKELGEEAVILNSKVVYSKGFLGLFKKKSIEVLAGMDTFESHSNIIDTPTIQIDYPEKMSDDIKRELEDLKQMVKSIQRPRMNDNYPEQFGAIIDYLKEQELAEELITTVSDELFVHMKQKNEEVELEDQIHLTEKCLAAHLNELPFGGISYQKKYINVLGPTGVGKTTTIAKMAARAVLEKKKKVGFITTDTYRIAAIEQLKTYAGLLQAPIEIVYSEKDLQEAMKKFELLDIVFIDTAGRNYKEIKFVEDLQKLIDFKENTETFLVLSSTSKQKDMEVIIEQFIDFPIEKFIFTKLDETNSIGSIINLMVKYKKGLAYYTDGQEVPEDIVESNLNELLSLFLKGIRYERSS
ncbi:flagellar biosynthesis protein FlhF [Psychrobacillus vulpis]|uniref:Flagellar biosynthesis protein FlhF n=1 Tax=Psychrobacillus vulpis TaxID=2325572 RepID=A0A544TTZ0_9BACI|nr:flagellar biosynthesis protein FlhF [Psychrobacillus vulpis]TQR20937.1 flagellar biosynthesis protein FlhF [Psychrobacillus vulpis]